MTSFRKTLRFWAEFAVLRAACGLFSHLPLSAARRVAFALADVWRLADRRHRDLAVRQSMQALGLTRDGAERLIRDNYRHYALSAMEVARLRRMPLEEVQKRTDVNGCDTIMADALARGKGLIVVTGHLGNWEWGSVVMGMLRRVEGLIARPLDNPHIDAFVRELRESTGATVWNKNGCMRKALVALKCGRAFVAVLDQDGGKKGLRAPFLGREASTMASPVDLAVRTGAPLLVTALMRSGEAARFTMRPKRVHWPRPGADRQAETLRLATEINSDLSEIIRDHPEQWIWIHKRWKSVAG